MKRNVKKTLKLWKLFLYLKFPFVSLRSIMRDKITEKSTELFLNLGFKSVTMDEIASALGVSKKTIYAHFNTKTALVEEVANKIFLVITEGILDIQTQEENPIREMYQVKRFVMHYLKDEKSSPQYQLQKYYPKIFQDLKKKQFHFMQTCIKENLRKGIKQKLFRASIDIDFIARIYFHGMMATKDRDLFPLQQLSMNDVTNYFLEYHLRGISTEEGIKQIEKQLIQK